MSRLTDKVKDTLTNRMQVARDSAVPGLMSKATATGQRLLRRYPILTGVMNRVQGHVPPPSRKLSGSGKRVPLGSGKGGMIGIVIPPADSTAKPGTPGEIVYGAEPIAINVGREVITIEVVNTADRPITVGSHYHFAEVNPALQFDRKAAWGRRQNIIAGGMSRFDPGVTQTVELVPFVGRRIAAGFRGDCGGPLDA